MKSGFPFLCPRSGESTVPISSKYLCSVFTGTLASIAVAATCAQATDFVVSSNRTTTLTLPAANDTAVVNQGVTIDTSAGVGNGISSDASSQTIVNNGTIFGNSSGIETEGSNTSITNHGRIDANVRGGVYFSGSNGTNNSITNFGTISTNGWQGVYFSETGGSFGRIDNYGSITSTVSQGVYLNSTDGNNYLVRNHNGGRIWSDSSQALFLGSTTGAFNRIENLAGGQIWSTASRAVYFSSTYGYRNQLVNYGDIWSTVSRGVLFSNLGGHGNQLINYGTIRSTGREAVEFSNFFSPEATVAAAVVAANNGVSVFTPANNALFNYGIIESTVGDGVYFNSTNNTEDLINAGLIRAAAGFNAIEISAAMAGANVTLLAGSVLDGGVLFGSPADTLNIGIGLNLYLDYDGVLETLNSAVPVIHDLANTIVYTVDPSGFASQNSFAGATTRAVNDIIRNAAGPENRFADAQPDDLSTTAAYGFGADDNDTSRAVATGWGTTFGGYQSQSGGGSTSAGDQFYSGFIAGRGAKTSHSSFGGFVGGSYSQLGTGFNTQEIDATSAFGGLYGGKRVGDNWISASATAGFAEFDSARKVANNAVPGGIQTATADYNGYFLSTSLNLTRSLSERLELTVGGQYAGLFVDGYSETGSAANQTVSDRDVHLASLNSQINYLAGMHTTKYGLLSVETWAGLDSSFDIGDNDVSLSINGAPLSFPATFNDNTLAGYAGIGASLKADDSDWSFDSSFEGRLGSDQFKEVKASFRLRKMF